MTRQLYEITLPIPPKAAHPNARSKTHYARASALAKGRQIAGHECYLQTLDRPKLTRAIVSSTWRLKTFKTGTFQRQDPDNLLAWLKCYFDGCQDARLLADDDQLIHMPPRQIAAGVGVTPTVTLAVRPMNETSEQIMQGIADGRDMVASLAEALVPEEGMTDIDASALHEANAKAMRDTLNLYKWTNPEGDQK